ncbi:MAG: DNA/RNA non-specific endonuclease [Clostridia bacterium]|nr:DNA/RNA non-specific endonuclease [Clostridia bacterium]
MTREPLETERENNEPESARRELPEHFESTYTLRPNESYESNRYYYETDNRGRIKHCEGTLRLEEGKRYNNHQTHSGGEDRRERDEGGHLIARQFGGSGRIDNLVPMDFDLNHGE